MKLVVNNKEISKAVQTVGTIVKGAHTLPILDNVLIELQDKKLIFTSDNLEVRSKVEIPMDFEGEIKTCVPYKLLSNILKGFPNIPIEMVFDDKTLKLLSETGTYTIPLVDPKPFPVAKEREIKETIKVNSTQLIDAIKKALLFTEKTNITNYHNVLISIKEEGTKIASTDGNVIFEYSMTAGGKSQDLTISRNIASHLIQVLSSNEDVDLSYSESHLFLTMKGKEINAILSSTGFPQYTRVFDLQNPDKKLTIDNSIIAPAIKRLYALTDQENQSVKFSIKDNLLELSFINQLQKYDAKETLPCEYTGEAIDIAFNANYINNMLTAIEESIEMNITDGTKPCLFVAENIRAIVGPINAN
jgi:DNA polymerase-3 subunit beta